MYLKIHKIYAQIYCYGRDRHGWKESFQRGGALQPAEALFSAVGDYYALYCSLENLDGVADVSIGIPAIVKTLKMI